MSIVDTNRWRARFEELSPCDIMPLSSCAQMPMLELKPPPVELNYILLGPTELLPLAMSSQTDETQKEKLFDDFREHLDTVDWTIANIEGISPVVCTSKIYWEDNAKPSRKIHHKLLYVRGRIHPSGGPCLLGLISTMCLLVIFRFFHFLYFYFSLFLVFFFFLSNNI